MALVADQKYGMIDKLSGSDIGFSSLQMRDDVQSRVEGVMTRLDWMGKYVKIATEDIWAVVYICKSCSLIRIEISVSFLALRLPWNYTSPAVSRCERCCLELSIY